MMMFQKDNYLRDQGNYMVMPRNDDYIRDQDKVVMSKDGN